MLKKYQISFFVIIVLGVIADQLSKNFAMSKLQDGPNFFGGMRLGFELAYNSGSAFSLFGGSTIILTVLSICICGYLIYSYPRGHSRLMQLAFNLIIAGALGNVIDRFVRTPYYGKGKVVDFLVLWDWPTFNIADSLVTIGVVLAVISTLFFSYPRHSEEHSDEESLFPENFDKYFTEDLLKDDYAPGWNFVSCTFGNDRSELRVRYTSTVGGDCTVIFESEEFGTVEEFYESSQRDNNEKDLTRDDYVDHFSGYLTVYVMESYGPLELDFVGELYYSEPDSWNTKGLIHDRKSAWVDPDNLQS